PSGNPEKCDASEFLGYNNDRETAKGRPPRQESASPSRPPEGDTTVMFDAALEVPCAAAVAFESALAAFEDLAEDMAAYQAGELEEFEVDFAAPFADPTPATQADLDAEAAYLDHLDRMQELDAYTEQLAAEA